eukprot:SAG25_NODE_794_length_5286_cov_3.737420_6_plen_273_part_00
MESGSQLWCTIICACTLATVYTLVCSDISIVLSDWFVMYYVARHPARMWHGAYDQDMADQFVSTHLMNRSEFFTKAPLTSIAASDQRFKDAKGNNWSGPLEGLTVQRAIRALESYGHHAESILIGLALTAALLPREGQRGKVVGGSYPQQIDPFTAIPEQGDGYGPMIMSYLEYVALRLGIVPRPERHALLWSALQPTGAATSYSYTQRLGDHNFTLALEPSGAFTAARDGVPLFHASGGVRVLTDLAGVVTEVWCVQAVHRFYVPHRNISS